MLKDRGFLVNQRNVYKLKPERKDDHLDFIMVFNHTSAYLSLNPHACFEVDYFWVLSKKRSES